MKKTFLGLGVAHIIIILIIIFAIGGTAFLSKHKLSNIPEDNGTVVNQMPIVTSGENPKPGDQVHGLPVEPAAAIARKDLATKLSISEGSIVIMQITDMTWNDSCLGLGKANESCLQTLVPGFRVEMLAKGKSYFYRTDRNGTTIRSETE